MHLRLAARRDLIQEERWTALAFSLEHASAEIERALSGLDRGVSQPLLDRMDMVRAHVCEGGYTPERLQYTVTMLGAVADSLAKLIVDLGLHSDRVGAGSAVDRSGPP